MKKSIVLGIISIMLILSACSTETTTEPATTGFEDTNNDGVQDVQLSYGRVGPSFNYIFSQDTVKVGEPVRINADVSKLKGCYRSVNIPSLGIRKYMTEEDNTLEFTPEEPGEILFTCSMGMGTARLTAE